MSNEIRPYRQSRRADNQAQTRRRITEAAIELHGSIGPARTTLSAIADLAGVQRATVYRHFPDERAILTACSTHFATLHPRPDPALWADTEDPPARLRVALDAFYSWYEEVAPMLANIIRDAPAQEEVNEVMQRRLAFQAGVEHDLARGWNTPAKRAVELSAALALALDFSAWRLLNAQGLSRARIVEFMARAVESATSPRS